MEKLLVICGPTATGKTSLALHLSKLYAGEIISADSRQVYKGMDIGTGKGLPVNSKLITQNSKLPGFYEMGGTRIWGYDLVDPRKEFSVGQYVKIAGKIVENILNRGKLPILVGGTGLYIKAVVDGIETASFPRNKDLRKSLEGKKVEELFEILAVKDPIKAASMNSSDRKNPRRLVRAIEVASQKSKIKNQRSQLMTKKDVLFIGLKAEKVVLNKRIADRVALRVNQGIINEVKTLQKNGIYWESQAMQAIGYGVWKDYLARKKEKEEIVSDWVKEERKYVKRQTAWFKKDKRVVWFDISKKAWKKSVEKTTGNWYYKAKI